MTPPVRKQMEAAGSYERVQGASSEVTLAGTGAKSILHRLIISNTSAADGTLTVLDGASTTLVVLQIPKFTTAVEGRPIMLEFNIGFVNDIRLTPSVNGIDCLAIYTK